MKTLKVEKRGTKKNLENMRDQGEVPAVFYGKKTDSTPISVHLGDFLKLWHEVGESGMFVLKNNGNEHNALIHEVQVHPVSEEPLHVDFYVVEKGQKVSVHIPLEFTGESPAVEDLGGVLVKVLHEVEVEAEPHNLPSRLEVDISALETFEDGITVADLKSMAGVEIKVDPDETVVLVQEPKEEEEGEEEIEGIDLDAIEVEGEVPEGEEAEEVAGGEEQDAAESKTDEEEER